MQVCTGDGKGWREARLLEPERSYAWRFWERVWTPQNVGRCGLRCRAVDSAGRVQPERQHADCENYVANLVIPVEIAVIPRTETTQKTSRFDQSRPADPTTMGPHHQGPAAPEQFDLKERCENVQAHCRWLIWQPVAPSRTSALVSAVLIRFRNSKTSISTRMTWRTSGWGYSPLHPSIVSTRKAVNHRRHRGGRSHRRRNARLPRLYTGAFKHVFDLVRHDRLRGTPVILTATGGNLSHSLVTEHELRPLFGFFGALSFRRRSTPPRATLITTPS